MGQLSYSFNNMGQQLIVSYQTDKVYTSINQELLYHAQVSGDDKQIEYLLTYVAQLMIDHIKEDIFSLVKKEWVQFSKPKATTPTIDNWIPTYQNSPNAGMELQKIVPGLKSANSVCPSNDCNYGNGIPSPLKAVIIHLNDSHHWTREQIADWLDTLDFDLTIHKAEEESPEPEIPLSSIEKIWAKESDAYDSFKFSQYMDASMVNAPPINLKNLFKGSGS